MSIKCADPCICGNEDPIKFRQYRDDDEKMIGKFCKECEIEWVNGKLLTSSCDVADAAFCGSEDLFLNLPIKLETNKAFQVQSARTKIESKYFAEILKKGDHVTWHRPKGIWHHSIVSEVDADKDEIEVIHWNKKRRMLQIFQDRMPMKTDDQDSLFNQMYRIEYPEKITQANVTELVIARARSRIGDTGYGLLSDNCEAFATYCKTGIAQSHQVTWLKEKVKECLELGNIKAVTKHGVRFLAKVQKGVPLAASEVIPAEVVEEALNASQGVGAGIIILIESGFVIWDLSQAYSERKDGKISRADFIEASTRRVVEGVASAGSAITCSIGMEIGIGCLFGLAFGPVGIVVGGIIGGAVGGIAGGAVGRVIGTWGGSLAGKIISRRFPDDRAVTDLNDLKPGDHVVLTGWFLHPRCHAIVIEHNKEDEVLMIRNTKQRGVVEEWMEINRPLVRVEYKRGACLEPVKVIENARSLLGQTRYSLATYNCKTFARECKTIPNLQKK